MAFSKLILALVFLFSYFGLIAPKAWAAADTILFSGKIFTRNPAQPWAEAVAIQGDKIEAVGSNTVILKMARAKSHKIDLTGHLLVPGLNDAHQHVGPSWDGMQLNLVSDPGQLSNPSFEDLSKAILASQKSAPSPSTWLFGQIGDLVLDNPNRCPKK